MTDQELLDWARAERRRIAPTGSMHPNWNMVFDAEAHARGERALVDRATTEQMIRENEHPEEIWYEGRRVADDGYTGVSYGWSPWIREPVVISKKDSGLTFAYVAFWLSAIIGGAVLGYAVIAIVGRTVDHFTP